MSSTRAQRVRRPHARRAKPTPRRSSTRKRPTSAVKTRTKALPVPAPLDDDLESTWRLIENGRPPRRRRSADAEPDDVGRALRRRRGYRRIGLEQAARETRIRRSYIEALESNAAVEVFPAPAYARAFLREYALYLGLDPERILAASDSLREAKPDPIAPLLLKPPSERAARWPLRAVAAGVLLIGALTVGGMEPGPPRKEPTKHVLDLAALGADHGLPESVTAKRPEPETVPPAVASGIALELRVDRYASWVRVEADDQPAFEGTLTPGTVRVFEARERLRLVVGNAAAVSVSLNGRPMEPLGVRGQVRRLVFALENGSVVVSSPDAGSIVAAPPAE